MTVRNGTPLCYIYVRVSHAKGFESVETQAKEDKSLQAQAARCLAYYESRVKHKEVELYPEVIVEPRVSARETPLRKRPKGKWLNSVLRHGDHVIFAYFDRSVRQLRDWANLLPEWQARGINIHFVDLDIDLSTPQGQMIANIMASVAQWESDQRSERCKAVAAWLKANGRCYGPTRRPGYKVIGPKGNRRVVHDHSQFPILRKIERLRHQGLSWEKISQIVESQECKKRGAQFSPSAFFKRTWTPWRCQAAYRNWQEIKRELGIEEDAAS